MARETTGRSERHYARITLKNGLDPVFCTYAMGSAPIVLLDFGRIAEALYDVGHGLPIEDIEITTSSVVPIGVEVIAARVPIWLAIDVISVGITYEPEDFDDLVIQIAHKVIDRLTCGIGYYATVDVETRRYTIVEN